MSLESNRQIKLSKSKSLIHVVLNVYVEYEVIRVDHENMDCPATHFLIENVGLKPFDRLRRD